MQNNPLLQSFDTPFGAISFDKIELKHYKPAIEIAISIGKKEIDTIVNSNDSPDFKNTIEALERAGYLVGQISSIFFNLNSAHTSDKMQEIAQEVSPLLTKFSNDIQLNSELFKRVKTVYETTDKSELNEEQAWLLEKTYKNFVRNGANLNDADKETLRKISTELSVLSLKFSENLLKDSNSFEMLLTNENDLEGLPDSFVEASAMLAKSKGKEKGWLITLDYPSYLPFMKYSKKRNLRKQLYLAFGSRGFKKNDFNNESILKKIVALRHKKANLLGYDSHADFILEERMAETPSQVYKLWDELLTHALPKAKSELAEVKNYAQQIDGLTELLNWDFSFYSEQFKKEKFNINDQLLKPYFKLENVISGAFETANKLYGITFKERFDIPLYHKDVRTFEVLRENGEFLAIFYADFFPRESKRSGAWMTSFKGQNNYDGNEQRPHVAIVCNFTKPTKNKPSLLTFDEVTTLFHEFGHALHGMFANGYYESLSGTNVYWDFVELPSQIMENWCYEKECLNLFAKHYETDEVIPMELVQKIKDSANFLSAYQTVRQVGLGQLDMAWHNLKKEINDTVYDFERKATEKTALFPEQKQTVTSTAFSHIFAGGYSAGYYSYKWAEVLEADAFELFKENGIFNKKIASSFVNHILSKGGSSHPMNLYVKFRGKKPTSKALLKKSGLISD
ncbi:MAG TPA: M3 family peptidase [Crocinitomix sp.]|nr:M3 family peptidase [Crocinitomix sp.]